MRSSLNEKTKCVDEKRRLESRKDDRKNENKDAVEET